MLDLLVSFVTAGSTEWNKRSGTEIPHLHNV